MLSLERQEEYRRRYAAENPGWRPATHVYLDLVSSALTPDTRLLDLGCGRGGILEQLQPRPQEVVGLDPDLDSLRTHRVSGLPRACGFAGQLPYADGAFDLVACSWVLEHLENPQWVFAEVTRVLAPGGRFVFVTPNAHNPLLLLNRILGWTRGSLVSRLYGREEADTFPAFYRANSPARIRSLMQKAGLDMEVLARVGDPSYLAFGSVFYRAACLLERATPSGLQVHLVGVAHRVKP